MDNQNNLVWDQNPTQGQNQQQGQQGLVWDGQDQNQKPPSDELQSDPNDTSFASKAAHAVGGTFEGIGEGVFGTGAGITDLIGGKGTGVSQALHHLAGDDNKQHGTAQNVGRGLETIGEFLLGDEALKGLSFADKLRQTSSVMKLIEKSPKLAKALQLGINVGKAGAELSPEERAILQKSPTLARLAAVGLDSVRAGVVQSGQTIAHGGSVGDAAKEGLGMAAGSAAIGAPLAGLGSILSRGAEGIKTAEGLGKVAEAAPTDEQLSSKLGDTVKGALQPKIDEAGNALQDATEKQSGIQSVASGLAEDAPTKEAITGKAQKAVQAAHDSLNDQYLKSAGEIKDQLKGESIPLKDSNIHKLADGLVKQGEKDKDELKDLFKIPNPISPEASTLMKRITKIAEGGKEEKEPATLTADKLMDFAKQVKENLRKTGFVDRTDRADRDVYFQMLDAIHNDFGEIANKAGKPEVKDALDSMNAAYKEGISKFSHPDVKKILQGNSETNILKLLQGTGSVKDVQTIRNTIGKDAYTQLVDSSFQRMAADSKNPLTGEFDFNKFFKNYNAIDPQVRNEMIDGSTKVGPIELAMSQYKNLNASDVIPNSETTIKEAQKMMDDLIGKGNVDRLIANPEKVQALQQLVGPEAMGELGHSVIQNQFRQAASRIGKDGVEIGPVDFNKVMDFFGKFKDKPELVDKLFRPTPETAAAYDKILSDVDNVKSAQKLVKLGLIAPAGLTAGALVGHLIGHPFWGMLIAASGEKYHGGQLLNYIADHPATWRAIKALDTVAEKPAAQGAGMLARYAAGRTTAVAGPPLSNALIGGAYNALGSK
jgi:hypothetical protein